MSSEALKSIGEVLLVVNYIAPVAGPVLASYFHSARTAVAPAIHVRSELVKYTNLSGEYDVFDYLNLASSIVHNDSTGRGVCRDYASETYRTYLGLIRQNGRRDLKSSVRLGASSYTVEDGERVLVGHAFIEARQDRGEFLFYESAKATPRLDPFNPEAVKEYTRMSFDKRLYDEWRSRDLVDTRTIPGTQIFYPSLGLLGRFPVGGFLQILLEGIRSRKSMASDIQEWREFHANIGR